MSRIWRVLAAVSVALLLALGSQPARAASAPADSDLVHGYIYDAHVMPNLVTNRALEPGPPANLTEGKSAPAVALGLYGALALPGVAAGHGYATYDQAESLAQVASVIGTTRGAGQATSGDLLALQRCGVAANAGRALGPARSTDLVLDSFRKLGAGRNSNVRVVGSVDELQGTFNTWTVGAERLAARGPKVPDVYRLPDGGTIQWRTSSGTGGPTIDIFPASGRQRTVHLADGVPW